jgi:hypothetical protein
MEKNVALTDEVLKQIAWEAIRANFSPDQIEGATLDLRHSVWPRGHDDGQIVGGGEVIQAWLMHQNPDQVSNAEAAGKATLQMIQAAHNFDPEVLMLFYQGFPDSPSTHCRAA